MGILLGAYLTGPIVPAFYYMRNKKLTPFLGGLAAGVITLPFVFLDLGIISSLPLLALEPVLWLPRLSPAARLKL